MFDGKLPNPAGAIVRALSEALGVGVLLHDADGDTTSCNPAAASILGIRTDAPPASATRTVLEGAIREDGTPFPPARFPALGALRAGAPVTNVVLGITRADGALAWIRLDSAPLPLAETGGVAAVTTVQDVTEHVLVEELLALQAAVASLPIGVVVGEIPPGGGIRIVAYNDRFREMVGAPPPEGRAVAGVGYRVFKPDRLTELPPDEWPGPKAARLGRAIHGVELHVLRSDGSWRVLLTSAAPVHAGGGGRNPGAVVVALDVTAHADAEPAKS